jgi:hypothetical protein
MRATLTLTLSFFALCCSGAWGQATAGFGALTGTIRDTAGEGIPDTTVVLINESIGIRRTLVTTDDGLFDALGLVPAPGYSIKVVRKGFTGWQTKDVQVFVGRKLEFNITLRATGEAANQPSDYILPAEVDDKLSISEQVTPEQMVDLPNYGHRWTALAELAPGTGDAPSGLVGIISEPLANSYLMDGIDVATTYYGARRGIGWLFGEGSVQEVGVLVSDYAPEFSHSMGGVVNGATRSGGNAFHGSFYDYLRTHSLSALDKYAAGRDLQQRRNQGGGGIGGPIFRNNLFFFANAEVIDGHSQGLNRITSSLIADPTGSFVAPANCATPNSAAQCTAVKNFVQPQMNAIVPRTDRVETGLARIDYRRRDRDAFTMEGDYMKWVAPNGAQIAPVSANGALLGDNGNYQQLSRFGKAGWVRELGGNVLNDLRVGWSKDEQIESAAPQFWPSTGPLGITVANATVGASALYPKWLSEERREVVENFTFTAGAHTMRVGIDWTKYVDYVSQLTAASGLYNYATLGSFAQDLTGITNQRKNYFSYAQTFGYPQRDYSPRLFNTYAADTWKLFPGFTVDYALHWERPTLPQPHWVNSNYPATGTINAPGLDFAPRVGATYTLGEHTAVRAGYGWFYAPYAGETLDTLFLGGQSGTGASSTWTGTPIFPTIFATQATSVKGSENLTFASSKFRNPYTKQATVAIEHEFAAKTVVTLSVLDSQGIKLLTADDLNLNPTTSAVIYTIVDATGKLVNKWAVNMYTARNDTGYGHLYQVENLGRSWYNAAMLQVRQPLSHGLALQFNYAFSHALDTVGNIPQGIALGSSANNYNADKGSSGSDQRQRATLAFTWRPAISSSSEPLRLLANGWQLSGIATGASSLPATPLILVSGQQFSSTTQAFANSLNGSGGWTRVPFDPVNSMRMSPEENLDARLARTFSFGERVKATVMLDAFNALNRQWNTGVNTVAFLAVSGVLKPVAGAGAGNASAVYDTSTARHCELALRLVF